MAEFQAGFKVYADPTAFEAGMARANAAGTSFKKALASIGVEARGMGLGLVLGVGIAALRNAVADARKTAEEAAKTGAGIDSGTAALVRFGDTMASLRGISTTVFGAVAAGMEKVGLFVGGLVYGFDNAADAAAKLKKEAEATAKALTDEKLIAAQRELAKFREETGFKRASDEEKINLLLARQVELLRQQHQVGKETAEGVKLQIEIEKNRVELGEVNARITKEQAKAAEEKAKLDAEAAALAAEQKRLREETLTAEQDQINAGYEREAQLKAQNAELEAQERRLSKMLALSNMLNAAGGEVFREASDAELRERMRRSQQRVIDQQNSLVGKDGSVGQMIVGADIARLQIEIANIKSEIATREELRRNYALGGEEMARRNFRGDPLAFDDEFARLVADTRTNKEIQAEALRQLREINDRQKNGIAVVNLNKK